MGAYEKPYGSGTRILPIIPTWNFQNTRKYYEIAVTFGADATKLDDYPPDTAYYGYVPFPGYQINQGMWDRTGIGYPMFGINKPVGTGSPFGTPGNYNAALFTAVPGTLDIIWKVNLDPGGTPADVIGATKLAQELVRGDIIQVYPGPYFDLAGTIGTSTAKRVSGTVAATKYLPVNQCPGCPFLGDTEVIVYITNLDIPNAGYDFTGVNEVQLFRQHDPVPFALEMSPDIRRGDIAFVTEGGDIIQSSKYGLTPDFWAFNTRRLPQMTNIINIGTTGGDVGTCTQLYAIW